MIFTNEKIDVFSSQFVIGHSKTILSQSEKKVKYSLEKKKEKNWLITLNELLHILKEDYYDR